MNPKQTKTLLEIACLLLVVSIVAVGCASGPAPLTRGKVVPWTVKITKAAEGSIEVDLIGVSKSEDDYWRNAVRMGEYWEPNSRIRKAVFDEKRAVTTRFESGSQFVLSKDDPIWKKWSSYGTFELAVMAHLTGNFPNPAADPRRLFLKLGKNEWIAENNTLELKILDAQIFVVTPPKP
jgi:hypothetical protein